jgi:hypothetical protein
VIITGHPAFFTHPAMQAIAEETLANITAFEQREEPPGLITAEMVRGWRERRDPRSRLYGKRSFSTQASQSFWKRSMSRRPSTSRSVL